MPAITQSMMHDALQKHEEEIRMMEEAQGNDVSFVKPKVGRPLLLSSRQTHEGQRGMGSGQYAKHHPFNTMLPFFRPGSRDLLSKQL